MAITFAVSEVARAEAPLSERPFEEALARSLGGPLEAWPRGAPALVSAGGSPLVTAMLLAFHEHRPLVLSPDALWLTLLNGFALHVNEHAEALRGRFVSHEGKRALRVRRDDFRLGDPSNDWPGAIAEMIAQLRAHAGAVADEVDLDFSTSDDAARVARNVALMAAMSPYFEYTFMTLCGIPEVTLTGTPEDWRRLRQGFEALAGYELGWWAAGAAPVLREFERAAAGEVDRAWWRSLFKWEGESGGPYITGHVLRLFPYLAPTGFGPAEVRAAPRNPHVRELRGHGLTMEEFPLGFAVAPAVWDYLGARIPLELSGGVLGVRQHPETLALEPVVSWALRRVQT